MRGNDIKAFLDKVSVAEPQQRAQLLDEAITLLTELNMQRPSQIPPDKQDVERVCRGIGHDFNGILANIRGLVEITQMMVPDAPDTVKGAFDKIQSMVDRGHHASEMIRLYGKVHDCDKSLFELTPFLKRSLNDIRIQLELPFQLQAMCPENIKLNMDANQLETLLLQLIKNARDALDEVSAEQLSISLSLDQNGLLLLNVQDQGCGIAADVKDKVYQPFYSTKKTGQGIGLGLSIARQIVMNHDGFIDYVSSPENGTTFSCSLPVIAQP